MSLIDRLCGFRDPENPELLDRIPILPFWAHLYELSQGVMTKSNILTTFSMDAGEEAELDWLIGRYNAQPTATAKAKFVDLVQVILILAEGETVGYTTPAQISARINAI